MELKKIDLERIERIKKLAQQLNPDDEMLSDWVIVSSALRNYEVDLKILIEKKRLRGGDTKWTLSIQISIGYKDSEC